MVKPLVSSPDCVKTNRWAGTLFPQVTLTIIKYVPIVITIILKSFPAFISSFKKIKESRIVKTKLDLLNGETLFTFPNCSAL